MVALLRPQVPLLLPFLDPDPRTLPAAFHDEEPLTLLRVTVVRALGRLGKDRADVNNALEKLLVTQPDGELRDAVEEALGL